MITARRATPRRWASAALGVPQKQLMESSGNAVATAVRDIVDPGSEVLIVAGRGNNGGDAFAAARFLDDYDLRIVLLGRPETISTAIARANWDALQAAEYPTETVTDSQAFDVDNPDLIVDAMLGTGVTGALREPEATVAEAINGAETPVLSVDVPSGVDADTGEAAGVAVAADRVVTFHDRKPGLSELDAEVSVADIGIPAAAETFVGPGDHLVLERSPDSHKGDNGEVLVIGGGPYTGAPALTAQAAYRAGSDLVRVVCPAAVAREIQGYEASLIVEAMPGDRIEPRHVDRLLELADGQDAVVLGPGLGDADPTREAVETFLAGFDGRAVVDADALSIVPAVDTEAALLCTPHQGELQKMGGETSADWRERADLVADFAADLGHTLLVKGRYDVISDGETTRVNRTGNPGMTVGGTGDVLAGAAGSLLARLDAQQAGAVAAHAVGDAGDRVSEEHTYGFLPTDLLARLPTALWGHHDD